jgi:hypothetical protein
MKKFIGTKQVKAEPMKLGEFIKTTGRNPYANSSDIHGTNEEGYIVEYEDGYKSWSPKEVFEKAYKVAETHIDRMSIEFEELRERMKKLKNFLYSYKVFELDKEEVYLLERQYNQMDSYAQTLFQRLKYAIKPEERILKGNPCECDCKSPCM